MPSGTEPSNARSALNLRLVLAAAGLVVCAVLAVAAFAGDLPFAGAALAALAVAALVDLVVIQRRRSTEQRPDASLFE